MVAGGSTVLTFMVVDGLLANEPIYYGLLAGLVAYVVVSLATRPTEEAVVEAWRRRLAGEPPDGPVTADRQPGGRPSGDRRGLRPRHRPEPAAGPDRLPDRPPTGHRRPTADRPRSPTGRRPHTTDTPTRSTT